MVEKNTPSSDALPPHTKGDSESLIKTISHNEFCQTGDAEIQQLLARYNVLVYDIPMGGLPLNFDLDGLSILCDPYKRRIVVQGEQTSCIYI